MLVLGEGAFVSRNTDGDGNGFDDQASDEIEENAFSDTRHPDVRGGLQSMAGPLYIREWVAVLRVARNSAFHFLP